MIRVHNRQRQLAVELRELQTFAECALSECLKIRHRKSGGLRHLSEINVILVSDRRMAELHQRFMNVPGATDVITFQDGEIFISTETAKRQARAYGTSLDHELRLYIVHGLLHLHGFDDRTARGAAEMKRVQERLVTSLPCPGLTL